MRRSSYRAGDTQIRTKPRAAPLKTSLPGSGSETKAERERQIWRGVLVEAGVLEVRRQCEQFELDVVGIAKDEHRSILHLGDR